MLLKFERLYLFFISILIGTAFPSAFHMLNSQTDLKMDIVCLDWHYSISIRAGRI